MWLVLGTMNHLAAVNFPLPDIKGSRAVRISTKPGVVMY